MSATQKQLQNAWMVAAEYFSVELREALYQLAMADLASRSLGSQLRPHRDALMSAYRAAQDRVDAERDRLWRENPHVSSHCAGLTERDAWIEAARYYDARYLRAWHSCERIDYAEDDDCDSAESEAADAAWETERDRIDALCPYPRGDQ